MCLSMFNLSIIFYPSIPSIHIYPWYSMVTCNQFVAQTPIYPSVQAMILPVCCHEEISDPTLRKGWG